LGRGLDPPHWPLKEDLFAVWVFCGWCDVANRSRVFFAIASPAAPRENSHAGASSRSYLFAASFDYATGADVIVDRIAADPQSASQPKQVVIERIDFVGTRRVRNDTLRARIFSRDGDVYNEETLRPRFSGPLEYSVFLKTSSSCRRSAKRSDARSSSLKSKSVPDPRMRYDGMHSISESDILDRFKELKVGLSVEASSIHKNQEAEVVLKELLGEHGRQFAKVTPQYERNRFSNAVILVFKIEEGPKVKVGKIKFTGNHASAIAIDSAHAPRPSLLDSFVLPGYRRALETYDAKNKPRISKSAFAGFTGTMATTGYRR